MYALVDCNNFYASCERVFNPAIRTRPVVVLSNNDGCVIARSSTVAPARTRSLSPSDTYRGKWRGSVTFSLGVGRWR
jgi:DNA polymerase V